MAIASRHLHVDLPERRRMGFEYGSQTIEIRNPFRLEGAAYLARGLLTAPLGVYLILNVPGELPFAAGVLLIGAACYAVSFPRLERPDEEFVPDDRADCC